MKSMKNIKEPSYAVNLGKGVFAGVNQSDWYCKFCMCKPSSGIISNGDYRPSGAGICSKSPTGFHVWEHY